MKNGISVMFLALAAGAAMIAVNAPSKAQNGTLPDQRMSFFITSAGSGKGGDLGGLEGADRLCRERALAAGGPDRDWRAFLSTSATPDKPGVDARDRIGSGPWFSSRGDAVGISVDDLFRPGSPINKETALDEYGNPIAGRGDTPNRHDILTGSTAEGRAAGDANCANWTSDGAGQARVGHFDRTGGGDNPNSWVSAHLSRSCSQPDLEATGGAGLIYCFAAD